METESDSKLIFLAPQFQENQTDAPQFQENQTDASPPAYTGSLSKLITT